MAEEIFRPGLDGVISNETELSYLDVEQEQIIIRGYDLIQLAQHLSYTSVAQLVIFGQIPNESDAKSFSENTKSQYELPEEIYQVLSLMPQDTMIMDALRTGISFLAGYENQDALMDINRGSNHEKGMRLFSKIPVIAVNAYRALAGLPFVKPDKSLSFTENFLYMIRGNYPDTQSVDGFDRILTCYVEHEMANSSFAARVISSTRSDVYGAIVGAVASLKGPLHGGANEAAINMMLDIYSKGGASQAENYLVEKLEQKARIMGFGHRVYMRNYDPRAYFLKDYIDGLVDRKPEGPELYAIYQKVEQVMLRERGLYPNADYPIALLMYLLDIPIILDTPIFLSARVPGLIGHVIEQHDNNRLFRPRVRYNGPRGLTP